MGLKISVIGGGSSYTPELFADLAEEAKPLDVEQVVLMDPNAERAAFIADVSERLIRTSGQKIRVRSTASLEEALSGSDFVILQVRVGGLAARVRDERIPMELGMVGNETTGAGGFACALRTVTATLEIARLIERLAPNAWVLNLSNPAGIVTEALLNHTSLRTLGFCNIPINTTCTLAEILDVPPAKLRIESFGLNHLSWVQRAFVDGEERLQQLIAESRDSGSILYQRGLVDDFMEPDFLRSLGLIPSWYVRYFYFPEQVLEEDRCEARTKGERDMQAEARLHEIFTTAGYDDEARHILASKGGAQYYLPVLQAMHAIVDDSGEVIVADVLNGQALTDLPAQACVELPARIHRTRAEPLPVGEMPLSVRGLVQTVKAYEQLAIEAVLTGSRNTAIQALMANPLVGSFERANRFFQRVLENERQFLPQFYS
ncbi:MAG: 6-phospho-beta-glucosidase [Bacteroidota bacterium]